MSNHIPRKNTALLKTGANSLRLSDVIRRHRLFRSWWRLHMETFSALLAICARNSPVTGEFPSQRPVIQSFDVFFDFCAWMNGWVNNREASDLRRHRTHYDVTVIVMLCCLRLITKVVSGIHLTFINIGRYHRYGHKITLVTYQVYHQTMLWKYSSGVQTTLWNKV